MSAKTSASQQDVNYYIVHMISEMLIITPRVHYYYYTCSYYCACNNKFELNSSSIPYLCQQKRTTAIAAAAERDLLHHAIDVCQKHDAKGMIELKKMTRKRRIMFWNNQQRNRHQIDQHSRSHSALNSSLPNSSH